MKATPQALPPFASAGDVENELSQLAWEKYVPPLFWMRGKHFLIFFSEVIEPLPNLMTSFLPFSLRSRAEPSNFPFELKQRRSCS